MTVEAPGSSGNLQWLLEDLTTRVPGMTGAVLLSADGLAAAAHGVDRDQAERLAAVASGLCSAARAAGIATGGDTEAGRIVLEYETKLIFVMAAAQGSVLLVITSSGADSRAVAYEMSKLISAVHPFMSTPSREAASPA